MTFEKKLLIEYNKLTPSIIKRCTDEDAGSVVPPFFFTYFYSCQNFGGVRYN